MSRVQPGLGGRATSGDPPRPHGWPRPERLDLPVADLPGVGTSLARSLGKLGFETVGDLLLRRPRRYESAADEVPIASLAGDEEVVVAGHVLNVRLRRLGGRRTLVTARVADASGAISASWF